MNALIEGLKALRLHGMAGCAQDLLASRTPPNLTTVLKQLIEAETVERRVRSIEYQMRVARSSNIRCALSPITKILPRLIMVYLP